MRTTTTKTTLLGSSILGGALFALALSAAPAAAQSALLDPEPQPQNDPTEVEDIVVTGSRIVRQDYVANSPIVTVGPEDFQATGSVTIDTLINELPQFVPAANQTSNNPSAGGQANVQLRGLGVQRTLVLINGRRVVPSNASSVVDLNLIPTALISRVETITGGASSTYGSDAVAGVLNFILNDSFEGVQLDLQYGWSDRDDAETDSVSLTIGGDIADGRGNAVLALNYAHRESVFNAARDFAAISGFSGTSPLGSTVFDATNLPSQAAITAAVPGAVNTNTFGFNNGGTIFAYQGARDFVSPGTIDYEGFRTDGPLRQTDFAYNTGPLNLMVLPQERYNVFGSVTYEINPAAEVYTDVLFSQYTSANELAATPAAATTTGFRVPVTNPFIPAELRAVLASRPTPGGTFRLDKRFNALGGRRGNENYNVYQITTGLRGDLEGTRDWTYDAYLSYGRVDNVTTQTGNVSRTAVQNLLNAADGGASLCAGGFNPFGETALSAACAAYIGRTSKNSVTSDLRVFELNIQGGLFDLPAGEVRFAVGGTYREQNYEFIPDASLAATVDLVPGPPTAEAEIAGFNAAQALRGADQVYEGYGELLIPVLRDLPLIQSFEVNLGYRVSDYDSVGAVDSYKADANWEVFDGLRIRGGVQRAVRAPSVGELFGPQNVNFPAIGAPVSSTGVRQFSGDPCDVRGAYRTGATAAGVRTLCLAQGVPTQVIDTYTFPNNQVAGLVGGNPDLIEETADSYTVGLVAQSPFQSPWLSGLSASIDYYSIEIEDVVGSVSVTEQLRRCYNADGVSNPNYDPNNFFCTLFQRDPASGQIFNTFETNGNLGTLRTSGVDLQVDWRLELADTIGRDWGLIDVNLTTGYLENWERQELPGGTFTDRTGTISNSFGLTFPEWKSLLSINYAVSDFVIGARWRRQGEVDNFNNRAQTLDAVDYFDLNGSFALNDTVSIRGGVNNLTDEEPPVYTPSIASNTDPSSYDLVGRRYYLALTARF